MLNNFVNVLFQSQMDKLVIGSNLEVVTSVQGKVTLTKICNDGDNLKTTIQLENDKIIVELEKEGYNKETSKFETYDEFADFKDFITNI